MIAERAADTVLAGKFRIEALLGAGAFGAVYAIRHELTRHRRALKLLHLQHRDNAAIVQRFLNEASAAGRAGNPHLVEVFDAGTLDSGEPYLVMELLEGETLGELLLKQGWLELRLAIELVGQAAAGVEAAHRAGIIHRDLKPDNLFIMQRDGAPFVKLLDFGVSKFTTESTAGKHGTRAGAACGTPAYMAPEQLSGDATLDGRADVFALGVVLFECLTGALPFDAPSVQGMAARLLAGEPTRIDALRPELPPELAAVVHRAIAQDRTQRYTSAEAFAAALVPMAALPELPARRALAMAETAVSGVVERVAARAEGESSLLQTTGSRTSSLVQIAGQSRRGRWLVAAGFLTLLILGALLTELARSPSAPVTRSQPASSRTDAASTSTGASAAEPERPLPAIAPTATSVLPEVPKSERPLSPVRQKPRPSAPVPPSAAPATPQRTRAQDLGLAEDNPFQ
jgi:serine/threonine-protein kinase